ncbi:unnamed protein product [Rotaria magnacalcarata]|uniref:O-methyltransferase C-terminal domain-containing protein n=1 Tax=Rotaria magnacalcarata TaxID=392030 RepID=A0A816M8A2_9BILA|nr:unnamed protein product [Rotaria magnacalcarata]CAF2160041.1 unnamed protein product [Rotaria magnacalcarata]CAF4107195.1 unnamed protein product [Rotaria magnacalcarata]CAF4194548.1 unnamed protein product [Rotaria magnacalcarata]
MAEYNNNIVHSPIELKGLSKYISLVIHRGVERAIWVFCELGIADLMASYQAPITASKLSKLNGNNWNAEFLYRLLRVIADADIITELKTDSENSNKYDHPEETIRFQLTEDGLLLTSSHFSKARDLIRFELNPTGENTNVYFPSLIKFGYENGTGFEQTFGCKVFDYLQKEENKEFANIFDNAMVTYSSHTASSMVSVIDFTRFHKLVDIAGGLGTLLSSILEKNQNLQGILFDLAHVIENAKMTNPNEFQRRQIEPNRYDFIVGDMFKSQTIPPGDAYILKHIIDSWDDEKSIEILKSIRDANKSQIEKTTTVFIIETIILSNDKDNLEAHAMDLVMLSETGAKGRTLAEYISLLNQSGYEMKQLYRANSLCSIIEAVTTTQNCDC